MDNSHPVAPKKKTNKKNIKKSTSKNIDSHETEAQDSHQIKDNERQDGDQQINEDCNNNEQHSNAPTDDQSEAHLTRNDDKVHHYEGPSSIILK